MNGIGNFKVLSLAATPTLDTGSTTAGDVLCAPIALAPSLTEVFEGEVVGVRVLDKSDQGAELDVVLLKSATALGTAGSAVSLSDTEAEEILTVVSLEADDYVDLVNSQIAEVECGRPIKMQGGALYLALIDRTGGKTYAAEGLVVTVLLRADDPR